MKTCQGCEHFLWGVKPACNHCAHPNAKQLALTDDTLCPPECPLGFGNPTPPPQPPVSEQCDAPTITTADAIMLAAVSEFETGLLGMAIRQLPTLGPEGNKKWIDDAKAQNGSYNVMRDQLKKKGLLK